LQNSFHISQLFKFRIRTSSKVDIIANVTEEKRKEWEKHQKEIQTNFE
jgi:hypothetical protein